MTKQTQGVAVPGVEPKPLLPFDRGATIQWATTGLTLILVLGPLVPILYQSFVDRPLYSTGQQFTGVNYANLVSDPAFHQVVFNSVVFSVIATLFAQFFGVLLAILIGRTDLPGRRFFGGILLWPLFLSHLLLTLGWFILYGPAGYVSLALRSWFGIEMSSLYSLGGMGLVAGVAQAPLTLLYCLASTSLADPRMEDAARSVGARPMAILFKITLPLMMPAVLYSGILNFTNSLEMLAIPFILGEPAGIRTFMTFIYTQAFSGTAPNYGVIGAASMVVLFVVITLIWLQGQILGDVRKFTSVTGKASRPRSIALHGLKWPAFILVACYVTFLIVLPTLAIVLRAFVPVLTPLIPFWNMLTINNFVAVLTSPTSQRAIFNTFLVSLIAAMVCTLLSALISIIVTKSNFRFRQWLAYVGQFPRAIPGMIVGIGILYTMIYVPQVGWLRNTFWILVIAYAARALPVGIGAISPTLMQISTDLDRGARVAGADWWTTITRIILPLIKPAMFSSFALMFINFTKEYATPIFLVAPGGEILGVSILQQWSQGNGAGAAALATIQMLLILIFLLIARRVLGVRIYG